MDAIKKFGDWDVVLRMTSRMGPVLDASLTRSLQQVTIKAEAMAVKFIAEQSLNWAPLSAQYMSRKARKGLSSKIYVASSTYFQSITSQIDGNRGFAGVLRKVRNADGESVADIAMVLEYGSIHRNIPPRKLWTVVFRSMRQFIVESRIFQLNAIHDIRRAGGI